MDLIHCPYVIVNMTNKSLDWLLGLEHNAGMSRYVRDNKEFPASIARKVTRSPWLDYKLRYSCCQVCGYEPCQCARNCQIDKPKCFNLGTILTGFGLWLLVNVLKGWMIAARWYGNSRATF